MKYDNFFFPADDLATSRRFYQDVLDLPVKFDFSENGMVAFRVGNEKPPSFSKSGKNSPIWLLLCGLKWKMCWQNMPHCRVGISAS